MTPEVKIVFEKAFDFTEKEKKEPWCWRVNVTIEGDDTKTTELLEVLAKNNITVNTSIYFHFASKEEAETEMRKFFDNLRNVVEEWRIQRNEIAEWIDKIETTI